LFLNIIIYFNLFKFHHFLRSLSEQGSCLSDAKGALTLEFEAEYGKYSLPGRFYTIDQQCQFIFGSFSRFCNGVSVFIKFLLLFVF